MSPTPSVQPAWIQHSEPGQRVAVIGDMHGDLPVLESILEHAHRASIQTAIQLGDFGFWPGPHGQQYIAGVHQALDQLNMHMIVIDGNHDWHEYLQQLSAAGPGLYPVTERLWYAARGTVFSLPGAPRCLAAGGAHSVDWARRRSGVDWWPQETMSGTEINRCLDAGPVDVVFAHDCPTAMATVMGVHLHLTTPDAVGHHRAVDAIWETSQPRYWFGGHYHQRAQADLHRPHSHTRFEILAHNRAPSLDDAWDAVDLANSPTPAGTP